jgi:hypothetical protein
MQVPPSLTTKFNCYFCHKVIDIFYMEYKITDNEGLSPVFSCVSCTDPLVRILKELEREKLKTSISGAEGV